MRTLTISICIFFICLNATADWPQYRADAARSGYTPDKLASELRPQWTYHPAHAPMPAWQGDDTRMPFDHAYHVAVADGKVFFGSSAEGKVHALDAATGEECWAFFADGPVRFAPAVWEDRVFAASDDGFLYCLSAVDGEVIWKKRGGPRGDMLLGNGRMVSRWPMRGGPAIIDGVVYFAAGIWPSEGIYLYALDVETGETLWLNDASGSIEMPQPHGGASAKSGVSAQGYLVAWDDTLLVPTGRAVPAAFDRDDGVLRYFRLQEYRASGGSPIVGAGEYFVNARQVFDTARGKSADVLNSAAVAVTPEYLVWASKSHIKGTGRENLIVVKDDVDRKGKPIRSKKLSGAAWTIEIPESDVVSLIAAGDKVVYGTADGKVAVADTKKLEVVWSADVDGRPLGLAVAGRHLYVSTDKGTIVCFGKKKSKGRTAPEPAGPLDGGEAIDSEAVDAIVAALGIEEGYCVDLGCGDGALAHELAKRTRLSIYAIDSDPAMVAAARRRLDGTGLYGTRVTVHHGDLAHTPYADYFADALVSGRSLAEGEAAVSRDEAMRLLRPCGGTMCVGRPGAMSAASRGPLDNAGSWTHQYADPANTCASDDALVRAPLRMLWFTDNDFAMPSRHGRGPAPLYKDGRLFIEGMHALRSIDAYNGRALWEYALPEVLVPYDQEHLVGTAATGSNLCMTDDGIYVRQDSRCLRLDAATGKQLGVFEAPGTWGYIACEDGTLFGSVSNTDHIVHWAYLGSDMTHIFTESSSFFAMDALTGDVKWTFKPERSIRHNAIAVANGRVYLIDRPLDFGDLLESERARRGAPPAADPQPPVLYALDAATGEALWSTDEDVYGTLLALSPKHDVLLMTQQHTRFKIPSETGGRMTAFRASDGTRLWDAPSDPQGKASRPLLIGGVIYNEPGAWDLLTGKRLDFHIDRSYGCGIMSGSPNMLLYRSATLGYADLTNNTGTINYGGIRPGCWINAIPAGGLVFLPDATARCTCSYLIKSSVALQPDPVGG